MSLRTYTLDSGRKRRGRRSSGAAATRWSLAWLLLPFLIPLAGLFAIVLVRVRLNSETEELHRRTSSLERELHDTSREIQHLRNRHIESFSRGQFITRQIARFELPLRNPRPGQMRNLGGDDPDDPSRQTPHPPRRLIISRR